jgi:CheY-like chemotaxis protein
MSKIILFHWHAAEYEERAERLRRAGHQVNALSKGDSAGLRPIRNDRPDAFVIDLQRMPSHGLAVATWLRQQKATRHVPLILVVGDPDKTERVRQQLPDAFYTSWGAIEDALHQAVATAPRKPVVPGTMDSYRGVPLARKLGIGAGSAVAFVGAPPGFEETLGTLPQDTRVLRQTRRRADVVLVFVRSRVELERGFVAGADRVTQGGRLWIAWPKRASGIASDVNQNTVRAFGLAAGWVDYKIAAVDATWSGLCFARRASRAASGLFTLRKTVVS